LIEVRKHDYKATCGNHIRCLKTLISSRCLKTLISSTCSAENLATDAVSIGYKILPIHLKIAYKILQTKTKVHLQNK
jgi:hypothetical protein